METAGGQDNLLNLYTCEAEMAELRGKEKKKKDGQLYSVWNKISEINYISPE